MTIAHVIESGQGLRSSAEMSDVCLSCQTTGADSRNAEYLINLLGTRRRIGPPKNDADPAERRKAPWLMLGLLNAARDYSDSHKPLLVFLGC